MAKAIYPSGSLDTTAVGDRVLEGGGYQRQPLKVCVHQGISRRLMTERKMKKTVFCEFFAHPDRSFGDEC